MAQVVKKTMARKKKTVSNVANGRIYIQSTFNNTIVTITDSTGKALASSSAGSLGFKGARKATPYAAQIATKTALDKSKAFGLQSVEIFVSGVGQGREQAIRSLQGTDIAVTAIKDVTPLPHNGCRPKKNRRV
ncbi:MAG: 30S ribosomal protein S11 [Patescibacteria group bacterium]|nr:30S ribosomal protein S11 [Patescibacteria group bacterium]